MKKFVLVTLAFAVFSGIVIAQTSAVMAYARENVARKPPPHAHPFSSRPQRGSSATAGERARERHHRADAPSRKIAQCAPDDRKCEVERKLKGLVFDPVYKF
jgi:hypothetical protein